MIWVVVVFMSMLNFGCSYQQSSSMLKSAEFKRHSLVPNQKVQQVLMQHQKELSRLPGVTKVSSGEGQIYVYTDYPPAVPSELEGVPIKTLPPGHMKRILPSICPPEDRECQKGIPSRAELRNPKSVVP